MWWLALFLLLKMPAQFLHKQFIIFLCCIFIGLIQTAASEEWCSLTDDSITNCPSWIAKRSFMMQRQVGMFDHSKNCKYSILLFANNLFSFLLLLQVWNQMTHVKSALKMLLVLRVNRHLMAVCDQRMECGNQGTYVVKCQDMNMYKRDVLLLLIGLSVSCAGQPFLHPCSLDMTSVFGPSWRNALAW